MVNLSIKVNVVPGPNCEHKISCAVCGRTTHKGGKGKHKYRWLVKCLNDGWVSPMTFTNRNHAMDMFRLHKHDSYKALSEDMQTAIKNLQDANLI